MTQTDKKSALSEGAPHGYDRLEEFFPTATARAQVLGASRDTIKVWDRKQATRLRAASTGRVLLVLAVCDRAARYMKTRVDVGKWMLTPQPALHGEEPARILQGLGEDAYGKLRRALEIASESDNGGAVFFGSGSELWDSLEEVMDPEELNRVRRAHDRVIAGAIPDGANIYELT